MFHLRGIAWKLCKAAKVHVMTSICIIALSISLIVTMASYVTNAKEQLDSQIDAMFGDMDILAGYDAGNGQLVSDELYRLIVELPEVNMVSPLSLEMTEIEHLTSVYTLGVENDELVKSRYHFTVDLTPETIVMSELLAEMVAVRVGDDVTLNGKLYEVSEVLPTPKGAQPVNMAFVHNDELKEAGSVGLFMLIQTEAVDEVVSSLKELANGIRIDIVDEYNFIKINLLTLSVLIVMLSMFVLLISTMLLMSTMQLVMTKVKEQLMILRSLGASAQHIGKLVQQQLLLIVTVGVVSGFLLSIAFVSVGLPKVTVLMKLPEATATYPFQSALPIIVFIGCGLLLYMRWQVRKALRILPMQLKVEAIEKPFKLTKWKVFLAGGMVVSGSLLMLIGQTDTTGKAALQIVFGSIILALVVLMMMPYIFQWLLNCTLKPIRKLFGKEAYLALQQLIPQVKMNMKVVLSLVGLIVILVFGSAALKTLQTNDLNYNNERFESEWMLDNAAIDETLTYEFVEQLEQIDSVQVKAVTSMGTSLRIGDEGYWYNLYATNFEKYGLVSNAQQIVVTEQYAAAKQLQVGDIVTPSFYDWPSDQEIVQQPLEIVKIVPHPYNEEAAYIDWTSSFAQKYMSIRTIHLDGLNDASVFAKVEDLLGYYPALQLLSKSVALQQSEEMFEQRWGLFVGVFVLLLVATIVGIIQTLLHIIYTNRSQYTIQRLLGLTPNGLVKLLCLQVLTFVLYGILVGIIVGGLLTKLLAVIDPVGPVLFDYAIVGAVSGVLLACMLIMLGLQGYVLSRSKLSEEMTCL